MKNWKTSLLGILAAVASMLQHSTDPKWKAIGTNVLDLSIALGLWLAADKSHPNLQDAAPAPVDKRQIPLMLLFALLLPLTLLTGCVSYVDPSGQRLTTFLQKSAVEGLRVNPKTGLSVKSAETSGDADMIRAIFDAGVQAGKLAKTAVAP